MGSHQKQILRVVEFLEKADSIFFVTGAGISADSGLPTYRGIGGLYDKKITDEGVPIEMALSGRMLAERPEITWKYLKQIETNCRNARFNKAHAIIAEIESVFKRTWVLTQNIDGFHSVAGSKNLIDIHGDFHNLVCLECDWSTQVKDYRDINIPPVCPQCKSLVRPDVVFFGETLPFAKTQILYKQLAEGFDLYFSIGTTSVFPYIREPILLAKQKGKPTVEINPGQTEISGIVDIKINLGASEAMEKIWNEYKGCQK